MVGRGWVVELQERQKMGGDVNVEGTRDRERVDHARGEGQAYINRPPRQVLDKILFHGMVIHMVDRSVIWIDSMPQKRQGEWNMGPRKLLLLRLRCTIGACIQPVRRKGVYHAGVIWVVDIHGCGGKVVVRHFAEENIDRVRVTVECIPAQVRCAWR